jgi:hypothetical protein
MSADRPDTVSASRKGREKRGADSGHPYIRTVSVREREDLFNPLSLADTLSGQADKVSAPRELAPGFRRPRPRLVQPAPGRNPRRGGANRPISRGLSVACTDKPEGRHRGGNPPAGAAGNGWPVSNVDRIRRRSAVVSMLLAASEPHPVCARGPLGMALSRSKRATSVASPTGDWIPWPRPRWVRRLRR